MTDIREEYGHEDPWGEFEDAEVFGADALYCGPNEVIEDLILLTEVCLDFEHWADDFRYWDRLASKLPNWEECSPFSELKSIEMANHGEDASTETPEVHIGGSVEDDDDEPTIDLGDWRPKKF